MEKACMTESPILLIDDEKGIRNVLKIVLADKGYVVLTATNGKEALKICEEHCPGIIFVDMEMPGMNGLEMIEKMNKRWKGRKVVLLTGHLEQNQFGNLDAPDICAILEKPISDEDIQRVLEKLQEC